jgi:DNA-binding response OmpR family regulator
VKILVVEDDSVLAEVLAYNLKADGFVADRAGRGDEAEGLLIKNLYDLVHG